MSIPTYFFCLDKNIKNTIYLYISLSYFFSRHPKAKLHTLPALDINL